ncbi:hypothetical protein [Nocardioides bigeumensis]|uniref:FHA domain-containing protein n=1 Tax=Nocardioides bigeumensis TaxID=433657 RepID=A0ABP5KC26_9ACTN
MEVEVRYAASSSTLLGSGARWLLIEGTPTPEQGDAVSGLLGRPGPVLDALIDLLVQQHPDGLPSLAAVDLTPDPGSATFVTRGSGRVDEEGDGAALSLGGETVRVRPLRSSSNEPDRWSSSERSERSERIVDTTRHLIDAIPAHILAAGAPDRESDAGRLARALDSTPRSAATEDPVITTESPGDPDHDGDHDGQTSFRPAVVRLSGQAPPGETDTDGDETDEDGRTVRSVARHLRPPTSETVLAVNCPDGHLTAAYAPDCRVCHQPVPTQDPRRVPRPRLGVLALPTGEVVPLDRGVVLGRKPRAVAGGEPYPHLVHLPAESTYLSRLHLQIELDGWLVLARDLGAAGGTRLHVPGRDPEQLRAQEAYVLEDGHKLDLADVYPVTFHVSQASG